MTRSRFVRTGLWNNADFLKLWAGETISIFGSLVGRTALVFTAVLVLDASALDIGMLTALDIVPGLLFGLIAGVWVDRLPRRAIMIVSDVGRAALLVTIPLAYALDALTMGQLFAVAFGTGTFTILFDVAYLTYLPTLVERDHVLEGNSRLAASHSASEVAGFGISGWLVQLLNGPVAILIDAVSFLALAVAVIGIRKHGRYRGRERIIHAKDDYSQGATIFVAALKNGWQTNFWKVGGLTTDDNCGSTANPPFVGWTGYHAHQGHQTACTGYQRGSTNLYANEKWTQVIHDMWWTEGYC